MKKFSSVVIGFLIGLMIIGSAMPASAAKVKEVEKNGKKTVETAKAVLDITNVNNGYFTASVLKEQKTKVKVTVEKDKVKYTYDLSAKPKAEVFPLQLGDGKYDIKVLFQAGSKYSVALSYQIEAKIKDKNAPFLFPNQQVDYKDDSKAIKKAAELVKKKKTTVEKVNTIYNHVITALVYDTKKAEDVTSGKITTYVPKVDDVFSTGKGICFDYAALFAAMLRSQGIPAKLVIGYVSTDKGNQYHAWNEFYVENKGWFKINEMKFDGVKFNRLDPTFESSSKGSSKALKFIGDGKNYSPTLTY